MAVIGSGGEPAERVFVRRAAAEITYLTVVGPKNIGSNVNIIAAQRCSRTDAAVMIWP